MNGRIRQSLVLLGSWWLATPAYAQLPITVEDIFVKQDSKELNVAVQYANRRSESSFGIPSGQFVAVVDESQYVDQMTVSLGARFGVLPDTELSLDASVIYADGRGFSQGRRFSYTERERAQLGLGFSHRLSQDAETPAFQLFGRLTVAEWSPDYASDLEYGSRASIGAVVYRTIDPVLLSVSALVAYSGARQTGAQVVEPGYVVQIEPRLSFFVNRAVTLAAGFSWAWASKARVNGRAVGSNATETALSYGLGYALGDRTSLQFQGSVDTTGDNGAVLRLEMVHRM